MIFNYNKTEYTYFKTLFVQKISQSISLFGLVLTIVLVDNFEKITSGEFNLIVDSKLAILIGIGIILIDALSAYSIVRTDKKTTGGMYGDYKIEINEDGINIEYDSKTKKIKKSEIEKIKLSKFIIIINFGNKDINITMSKYFFKSFTEFKALRKLLEKYNAKKISKDLFG